MNVCWSYIRDSRHSYDIHYFHRMYYKTIVCPEIGKLSENGPNVLVNVNNWKLHCLQRHVSLSKKPLKSISKETWEPPQNSHIKLNYNGASKGNPGPSGEEWAFWTQEEK